MELVDRIEFAYPVSTMFEADSTWLFGREPTPRRMPDGSIVSLLYTGGKQEPAPENVATVIRSEDDGETWSKPQLLFRHPFRCTWGTELFTEGERPFAVCDIWVEHTGYRMLHVEGVQIFPGVETRQDAELLPLPEHPTAGDMTTVVDVTPQPL